MPDLPAFQQRLAYQFRHADLLQLALTHPSIAHEQDSSAPHNQRLEYLGDAILSAVLSQHLYDKFPVADEGRLTKSRAKLVNSRSLAARARAIGLGAYLILSRGEENTGGRSRPSILADAFEALLGAIFLDGGFPAARDFILREFAAEFAELDFPEAIENPKGELQEILQARSSAAPIYHTISAAGPDHDRNFICAVLHEGVELAQGSGKSKKEAESDAALAALKKLRESAPASPPPKSESI
jgi:ribonuclease-3